MNFATRYAPPPSPSLACEDASRTRQEFAEEADLNNIMRKYAAGDMAALPAGGRQPMFGDFSNVPDFAGAREIVDRAEAAFAALPAALRDRFANDPANLIDFVADKGNYDEAVKLGLVKQPTPQQTPQRTQQQTPQQTVSVPPQEGGS